MNKKSDQPFLTKVESLLNKHAGIDELEVLCVDLCGHFFGKRYPVEKIKSFARDGLALPMSMFVLSTVGEALDGIYYGVDDGDPDAHFHIIEDSLAVNTWGSKPRLQVMVTSTNDNKPVYFEPRNVLERVLKQFEKKNWRPMVAFELEFYLFAPDRDDNGIIKIVRNPKTGQLDTPMVLSSSRISDFEVIIDDIIDACKLQNIETGAISSEMGAGQYEINFNHHHDVLRAADETCLFKRIVMEIAKKHGMMGSFIAKPMLEQPGNGLHMHISLVDKRGNNIFAAGDKPHQRLLHAIGGLIDSMPAAMSFWAPNINSFRRYVGGTNCAPVSLTWGNENRTVAFRIPLAKDGAWRVENRVPGADTNPYLAMSITLAGILHGIDQKIDPGKPYNQAVNGRDENLPLSLAAALGATIGNEALMTILGRDFIELYCQQREAETMAFEQYISAREYDWYL
ncbi:MAG: glutamine synthetase [Gammaproteobacteria bacterium]|nr:glutamine synthetase [Gammaproteobacteria bacterium]